MKELFTVFSWKRLLTMLTALVLTVGFCFSALPARAEGETDGIKDAVYRMLKQKLEESTASYEQEAGEPAAVPSAPAAEENKEDESTQEAFTSYLKVKFSGKAVVTDVTAQLAQYYPDVKVLTAYQVENPNAVRSATVYVNKAPKLSNGDYLELVGLNGLQINPKIAVSGIAQGQMIMLNFGAIDGFALIVRHPAPQHAEPAKQPEAPAAEQPAVQPEPAAEEPADEPSEEPAAEELEKPAEKPADESSEESAAEEPEEPADEPSEEPAAEEPEEPAEEPEDEPSEEPAAEKSADEPSEEPAAEEPEASAEEPADEPSEEPAAEEPEAPAEESSEEQPADEPSEEPADEQPADTPVLSYQTMSADLGDGAVAVLSGSLPENAAMEIRLLSVSVVKLIDQMLTKDHELMDLYAFDLNLKTADGTPAEIDGELTMVISGGKVAEALAAGQELVVSTLAKDKAMGKVNFTILDGAISFPVELSVAYQINAAAPADAQETEEPENTENPEDTVKTEETDIPEVTEAPEGTENAEDTETPEVPEGTETEPDEEPEDSESEEAPADAQETEEPENTANPEDTVKTEETDTPEVTEVPEEAENAEDTETPEASEETETESDAEPAESAEDLEKEEAPVETAEEPGLTPMSVTIQSSMTGMIRLGDPVTLTGLVENASGELIYYLWECDRGAGFEPVEGAEGATVSFAATEESLMWNWRLTVLAENVQAPAAAASNDI